MAAAGADAFRLALQLQGEGRADIAFTRLASPQMQDPVTPCNFVVKTLFSEKSSKH
jgi:hypothetical protein